MNEVDGRFESWYIAPMRAFSLIALSSLFVLVTSSFGNSELPKTFLWGVANSAFQVEGSPVDSDAYRWTHEAGKIKDGSNADIATDFWNRYDEDFTLAQGLGANAFRISIAWERIEPQRGEWNEEAFQHYERILLAMRARGLEPVVTLFHSVLPMWVAEKGGVLSPTFPSDFAEYATKVVDRLAHGSIQVRYWLTVNEPTTYAEGHYIDGTSPTDGKSSELNFLKAINRQADAHIAAYRSIHELPNSDWIEVGYAQDWEDFQPKNKWNPLDRLAQLITEKIYNRSFICRVMGAMADGRNAIDFLGINYYNRNIVSFTFKGFVKVEPGPGALSDTNQEVYPQGMENVLRQAKSYHLPILVTENGLADSTDHLRPDFLREHIRYLLKARDHDHIPVFGYLHWSLTDNFEWDSGFGPRYGLVEIDYANNLKRIPRPSYSVYQSLIRENQ